MTKNEILDELRHYGNEQTQSTHIKHGAKEPLFGVKIQDLKKILKKTKKNHALSLELYATGISDAMYLAGLMADEKKMTQDQLEEWVKNAYWYYLSEYTVPWVAAETPYGYDLGLKWIASDSESIASAGWATLSNVAAVTSDDNLNISTYSLLLDKVEKEIHQSKNRVRYVMNGFVIAIGGYITDLTEKSKKIAKNIGKVSVDMGGTACKVPLATDYIKKMEQRGIVGRKKKVARC